MRSNILLSALLGGGVMFFTQAAPAQDANREVVIAPTDVGGVVDRLAKRSEDFKHEFDKAVDDTKMEGPGKQAADAFHDSAKKLKDEFGDHKDKNDREIRTQVDKTLGDASAINKVMQRNRFTDKLQRDWSLLRGDMNALATVYGLSPIQ